MDIYLRNDSGNWATIKRVAPTSIESKLGSCVTSKCAVGLITIDKVLPRDKHSSNDIRSMMIVITEDIIQEFYGVTIFDIDDSKNWTKQVDGMIDKKINLTVVHPKTMTDGKNYLFFANRYNVKGSRK